MRIQFWAALVVALLLTCSVAFPQTPSNKTIELPLDLVDQVKNDLGWENCSDTPDISFEHGIEVKKLNLRQKDEASLLVHGIVICMSGLTNSTYLIYHRFGNRWRKIMDFNGNEPNMQSSVAKGWNEIEACDHFDAFSGSCTLFRFHGTEYIAVFCDEFKNSDMKGTDPNLIYKPCESRPGSKKLPQRFKSK